MANYTLTSEADKDLSGIWDYTYNKWGIEQARKYLSALESRLFDLASSPNKGKKRYDIIGYPLSYHEGRHVIFYREGRDENKIEILRVLYDAMDFYRYLNKQD